VIAPRDLAGLEERIRGRLREIEEALRDSADALNAVGLDQTSVGRLSRMDALQQQATRVGLRDAMLRERRRAEAALARIQEKTYGTCCACGHAVPLERLQADPAAPFCMECEIQISQKIRPRG
jgi:DnaK suppressor protein